MVVNNNTNNGIGVTGLLWVILITLKIIGVLPWSWLLVFLFPVVWVVGWLSLAGVIMLLGLCIATIVDNLNPST